MRELEKRLVSLFTGETVSAILFLFVYWHYFSSQHSYPLLFALIILNFILLQGAFYWFCMWLRLKSRKPVIRHFHRYYYILKNINRILLWTAPLLILVLAVTTETAILTVLLTIFIYAFAVIEYINYFHIQLTNYKNGRGKISSIAKMLKNKSPVR